MVLVDSLQMLVVHEVATMLRLSESAVYALIREHILPAVHVGRSVRIDEQAVRDFIARGGRAYPGGWRKEPPPPAAA